MRSNTGLPGLAGVLRPSTRRPFFISVRSPQCPRVLPEKSSRQRRTYARLAVKGQEECDQSRDELKWTPRGVEARPRGRLVEFGS